MKKSTAAIAAVAVVIVAGGAGYYLIRQRAVEQLDAGIAAFRTSLAPGSSFTYASASPQLFSRSGHFTDVVLTTRGRTTTAATLDVSPGDGGTLRHVEATGITGKAPGLQLSAERFGVDALAMPTPPPTPTPTPTPTPGSAASIADSDPALVTFDHATVHGLHSTPDANGSLDVTDVVVDNYGAGRASTVDLAGFVATSKDTPVDHVSLDHARLGRFPLADAIVRSRSGNSSWLRGLDYALDLSGLSATVAGKPFVTLASLTNGVDRNGGDQLETRLDAKDLVVMVTPGLTPGLSELGYDRFQGGMQMHATTDRKTQQMRMDRLDIDAPAMGRLHLALGLDNIPDDTIALAPGATSGLVSGAMMQARLQSAELTYEDHSLAGKAFAAAANQQGTTPAALKQKDIAMLNAIGAQVHLGPAVLDPIAAFINDPHRLVVAVKPPQPVALVNLSSVVADLQHSLGLAVSN